MRGPRSLVGGRRVLAGAGGMKPLTAMGALWFALVVGALHAVFDIEPDEQASGRVMPVPVGIEVVTRWGK